MKYITEKIILIQLVIKNCHLKFYSEHGHKLNFSNNEDGGQQKGIPTLHKSLNCVRVQYLYIINTHKSFNIFL